VTCCHLRTLALEHMVHGCMGEQATWRLDDAREPFRRCLNMLCTRRAGQFHPTGRARCRQDRRGSHPQNPRAPENAPPTPHSSRRVPCRLMRDTTRTTRTPATLLPTAHRTAHRTHAHTARTAHTHARTCYCRTTCHAHTACTRTHTRAHTHTHTHRLGPHLLPLYTTKHPFPAAAARAFPVTTLMLRMAQRHNCWYRRVYVLQTPLPPTTSQTTRHHLSEKTQRRGWAYYSPLVTLPPLHCSTVGISRGDARGRDERGTPAARHHYRCRF